MPERYPGFRGPGGYPRRFNIAPTQDVLAARPDHAIVSMRWGLVPRWSADLATGRQLINARVETLAEKPAFRDALRARRCVVFADGFYEWTGAKKQRLPHRFIVDGGAPFAFAALYESGRPDRAPDTCTLVTCAPNPMMQRYHDRMPAILDDAALEAWLQGSVDDALAAVVPLDERRMEAYPVTPAMNNAAFEDPRCIEPLPGGAPPSLFDAPGSRGSPS